MITRTNLTWLCLPGLWVAWLALTAVSNLPAAPARGDDTASAGLLPADEADDRKPPPARRKRRPRDPVVKKQDGAELEAPQDAQIDAEIQKHLEELLESDPYRKPDERGTRPPPRRDPKTGRPSQKATEE